eukprot:CAMPEP_0185763374 /NCGR_PEP_ID=MMETSP1174-20130828/22306_1 /TAXON_ID=35687 /ORGANISM="Dictyocha speculum, Strain CCMP1381" /LENGTH=75 /DNA_ID=CAMNT_0028445461 /DNA_START=818 /DNA_END=1045 /DNA_ORIENTATION=-
MAHHDITQGASDVFGHGSSGPGDEDRCAVGGEVGIDQRALCSNQVTHVNLLGLVSREGGVHHKLVTILRGPLRTI